MRAVEYGSVFVWGEAAKGALGESKEDEMSFDNNETEILKPRGMKVEALVTHEAYHAYLKKRRISGGGGARKGTEEDDAASNDSFNNQVMDELGDKDSEYPPAMEMKKMHTMVRTLEFTRFKKIKLGEKHSLFSIDGVLFGMGINKNGILGVGH